MSKPRQNGIRVYATAYDKNVTGSSLYITIEWPDGYKIHFLVDCGQFFGAEVKYNFKLPYRAEKVDFVLITHAHIDHIGVLPYLIYKGFVGPIYSPIGTALLIPDAIESSGNIVINEYKHKKKKPPFRSEDVDKVITNVSNHSKSFNQEYEYKGRIFFTFLQNQHILGASSIFVRIVDPRGDAKDVTLFFAGDYNNRHLFIPKVQIPEYISKTHPSVMFTESTYGDSKSTDVKYHFQNDIEDFINNYQTLIIYAFALGRTQDFLFIIRKAQDKGTIGDEVEIWLDGQLAINNTILIYNNPELFNIPESAQDFLPRNLYLCSKDFRQELAFSNKKKIIITSSGNGSFGPAKNYIAWKLPDPKTMMIFGGYCTKDSLGYELMNTPYGESVPIFGTPVIKNADVRYLEEASAHGRSDVLVENVRNVNPRSVIINHGELKKQRALKTTIDNEVHPPKGTHIANRTTTFVINSYGVEKSFHSDISYF